METIGELNFDDMRDEDILKTVKYLQKNVNNFDIVAKQISGGDNYLEDAEKAKVILEELSDVIEAGSNCGISGFIYHADTSKFYKDNYRVIVDLVEDMAQEGGYKNSLDFLAQTEGASLDNIEDTCAKIFLENVAFQVVNTDTDDLDLSEEQDNDLWNDIKTEIILNELIASGCKFAFSDEEGGIDKVETDDVKEIIKDIESYDGEPLQVYKDNKYVGFLRVSEDDTETISDYSQNLNEFSETLYSIKAISDYVDNYNEEKQNSNTRKHK